MLRFCFFLILAASALPPVPTVALAQVASRKAAADTADVRFVRGMMHHHAQAIVMSNLAPTHTTRPDILIVTRKIGVSQRDEIALMARWLDRRGQSAPAVDTAPPDVPMPGMSMPSM